MSVDPKDVRWGTYKGYEGPWYPGTVKFTLPDEPTELDKVAAVVTATEGGHLDAINRYDKCIDTQGLIQWCNRHPQHSVDNVYRLIAAMDESVLLPVAAVAARDGYRFNKTTCRWHHQEMGAVDSPKKQARMYFTGATGRKGGWDDGRKWFAKEWVAAAADVWQSPIAQQCQMRFTMDRLERFFVFGKEAKALMRLAKDADNPHAQVFRAAYISFAANNPKKASEALKKSLSTGRAVIWSNGWLFSMLHHLTFDPGISIYPHRYNKIRPVLEKLYKVDLPDFAADLEEHKSKFPERSLDPTEVQRALIALGYDLGPAGADGKFMAKSRAALMEFEQDVGVPAHAVDGVLDPWTTDALECSLEEHGSANLSPA